ncbi:hypothetical protein WICPIJ_003126 [Wickerhamomyces pijperi]|uniref:Uncharacterized protein n=1 Tax=Wickerhamomyces pijperi TaxID=599730 RepID=A0A9P8QAE9_WICPI|nr:hypothetical protein WICPIJ_003126 [Wickerhamomyces pijperi]
MIGVTFLDDDFFNLISSKSFNKVLFKSLCLDNSDSDNCKALELLATECNESLYLASNSTNLARTVESSSSLSLRRDTSWPKDLFVVSWV